MTPPHGLEYSWGRGKLIFTALLFNTISSWKGDRPLERRLETMAVRIIIDRKVKKGKEGEFFALLKELRSRAVSSKGYISGETLRALSDPHNYVVLSTWQSADAWKEWEKNPERKKVQSQLDKIVARRTKTKIYAYA
jgi:heme oxygenase (mycobilin-producing)